MRVVKIITLWMKNLMLINQLLQTPRIFSCQLKSFQCMRLPNMVCWILSEDYIKVSLKETHIMMENLKNYILKNEWCARKPVLWTHIQFSNFQMFPCLKIIHTFKSLFWFNGPVSCCWVDKIGRNCYGEHLWRWFSEFCTFAWSSVIVDNISFVQ